MIPAEALNQRVPDADNDMGKAYQVRILTESGLEERVIHAGLQTRTQAQVTAGLEAGERILVKRPGVSDAPESDRRRDGLRRFGGGLRL
jgi:macrolide-specific efflux system membrane fusion protein